MAVKLKNEDVMLLAGKFLEGILLRKEGSWGSADGTASDAIYFADALIEALNRTQKDNE